MLELIEPRGLGPESLVVELASNDGYLLRNYVEHGIPVLGIDPASGPARAAEKTGVPTLNEFFTWELAAAAGRPRGGGPTSSTPTTCWPTWRTPTVSWRASPRC